MSKINKKTVICVDLSNINKANIKKLSDIVGYSPERIMNFKKEGASKVFFDYGDKIAIAVIDKKAKTTESYKGLILINTDYYSISKREKDMLLSMNDNLEVFYEKEYSRNNAPNNEGEYEGENEHNAFKYLEALGKMISGDLDQGKLEEMLLVSQKYMKKIEEIGNNPMLEREISLEYMNDIRKIVRNENNDNNKKQESTKSIEERIQSILSSISGDNVKFEFLTEVEEESYDLDEILEKIHEHGKESLTEGELKFLNNIK